MMGFDFGPMLYSTDPTFSIDVCKKGMLKKENKHMNKNEIKAVRNYNDRAMVMQFSKTDDNGKAIQTRCEVQEGDTFDLDEGIKTCLLKYLLGGHKNYMKIMDAARKTYKKTMEADKKAVENNLKKSYKNLLKTLTDSEKAKKRERDNKEFLVDTIKKALEEYDREKASASCDMEEEDK